MKKHNITLLSPTPLPLLFPSLLPSSSRCCRCRSLALVYEFFWNSLLAQMEDAISRTNVNIGRTALFKPGLLLMLLLLLLLLRR